MPPRSRKRSGSNNARKARGAAGARAGGAAQAAPQPGDEPELGFQDPYEDDVAADETPMDGVESKAGDDDGVELPPGYLDRVLASDAPAAEAVPDVEIVPPALEDDDEAAGLPPVVAYHPNMPDVEQQGELERSETAYTMYHAIGWEWPCLSFDIVRDNLGEERSRFPLTAFAVSGSQAPAGQNRLTLLKMSDLHRTQHQGDSDDEAEEIDELDRALDAPDVVDVDPLLDFRTIPHDGVVNRVRCMRQHPNIVASWSDTGAVHVWNMAAPLLSFDAPQPGATNVQPCFSLTAHASEGFAMDWSPLTAGRLLTGDCSRYIYLWEPDTAADVPAWGVDLRPFGAHTASVEDLQWSPVQADVFASCSVDRTVRVWDARTRARSMIAVEAHAADVNVISWNRTATHLLVSGSDDGSFKVWDLRRFDAGQPPIGHFQWHQGPVTSVEWHPTDDSVLAVSGEDNQVSIWDLSLEEDPEARVQWKGAQPPEGIPPQLLFVHQGQTDIKEVHFHPQLPGVIMSTALDGFNVFLPSPLAGGSAADEDMDAEAEAAADAVVAGEAAALEGAEL